MSEKAPDYSQKTSWYKIPEITKDVDTFYIYSTVYFGANEGDPDYATLDNAEMLAGMEVEHAIKSSVFEESTNVFMPLYRQAGMKIEADAWMKDKNIDGPLTSAPYGDITAALDYYFENYNGGRPFVIAGHSQGAAILRLVLKGYFKEHPEHYERMVAAYAIGYSITKDDLEANPHMKFATGETDTGVIISWNTEGPKNVEENSEPGPAAERHQHQPAELEARRDVRAGQHESGFNRDGRGDRHDRDPRHRRRRAGVRRPRHGRDECRRRTQRNARVRRSAELPPRRLLDLLQ